MRKESEKKVRKFRPAMQIAPAPKAGHIVITGGAGFVGTNLAHRLMSGGHRVVVLDNLSRDGVERNLRWLRTTHGELLDFEEGDVRDVRLVRRAVKDATHVFHFAAQVAVTTSLTNPLEDFDVNARGTLNLLEAIRGASKPPALLFTSTNKVYGRLPDVPLRELDTRYEPSEPLLRANGISERRPLDFHSPYGCSKGAADQYVIDYGRTYSLPTLVLRMSCIYGPHQFGTEDQGWVAHFLIRAMEGKEICIYGDGKQVRDILFVDDLVDAFVLACGNMDELSARAFNIGGGPQNTISLLEFLEVIGQIHGELPALSFNDWRTGDQQYYVSDTRAFEQATGWRASTDVRTGVERLYDWLVESRSPAPAHLVASKALDLTGS